MSTFPTRPLIWLLLGLALLIGIGETPPVAGYGEASSGAVGTAFTYQGRLDDANGPVNGSCDLQFLLFDALGGGSQVGSTVTISNQPVVDGLFIVQLDFGAVFDGNDRYLEIAVRCPAGSGAYETIMPRQFLQPAPYAIYSGASPWSGLTGVPAGFADDTDDDTTYAAGAGLVLNGTTFSTQGSPYGNTIVVAKSGGDFSSIQAALDSITDAADNNRYLVWVAPGIYTESVIMKDYVDIEGAGQNVTKITAPGSASFSDATVRGANDAALRNLTVESTGGDSYAMAIYVDGTSTIVADVTAVASGSTGNNGSNMAIRFADSTGALTRAAATASGFANNYAVVISGTAAPIISDVTATANGGLWSTAFGIYGSTSSNHNVTLTRVVATAHSGLTVNFGIWVGAGLANLRINQSIINATGVTAYGIFTDSGDHTYKVSMSEVDGSTASLTGNSFVSFTVLGSQLNGGPVEPRGSILNCVDTHNDNGQTLNSACEVQTEDGLVKASVFARCDSTGSTIHRSFSRLSNSVTISDGSVVGRCIIDFNFSLNNRYWQATGSHASQTRDVTCYQISTQQLECYRYTTNGAGADGDIMVTVN
ncbi:MAG: hypothetical protein KDE59_14325 [Anaerolineales bacterium]|nr:hypothetical protein [Anaerolineales bacterium]